MPDAIVKVGERGQIVIPAEIRRREGIEPNSYLRIVDQDGRIVLRKLELESVEELVAALQASGLSSQDWNEVLQDRDEEL